MDAKAKVVAYLVTGPATATSLKSSYAYTLEECDNAVNPDHEPLIKLTDHEAALAELTERHAATERNACLIAELANDEKRQRQELLTGLEALAADCVESSKYCGYITEERQAYIDIAVKIRTLTNPANSENHEVLKS